MIVTRIEQPGALAWIALPCLLFLGVPMSHAQATYEDEASVQPTSPVRAKHKVSNLTYRPGGIMEEAGFAELDPEDKGELDTLRSLQTGEPGP